MVMSDTVNVSQHLLCLLQKTFFSDFQEKNKRVTNEGGACVNARQCACLSWSEQFVLRGESLLMSQRSKFTANNSSKKQLENLKRVTPITSPSSPD